MKAVVDGTTIAEAQQDDLAYIEGNWYFPRSSLVSEFFIESPTAYTCPWKGAAQYFDVKIGDKVVKDGAWSYSDLRPGAVERVGKDFAGFVAFDRSVTVAE
ncbi:MULTISPECIES: DUF427 domain-containing protein [Microbacterium]|uniref:DUF427 domain-containing protein n=1 Tax=Microbacterium marmarense TaxID=3122051 RepID=A0ABU8LSA0_9MICO